MLHVDSASISHMRHLFHLVKDSGYDIIMLAIED
jgi:hypothetical protein